MLEQPTPYLEMWLKEILMEIPNGMKILDAGAGEVNTKNIVNI